MITPPNDPFSRPPLAGSVSDKNWVKSNASLFSANAGWFFLKAVLFLVVVLVAVAMLSVFFGPTVTSVFVLLLVAALLVLGLRRQRRRRAQVPRW
jgi:Flp pilus assembly protein TadB